MITDYFDKVLYINLSHRTDRKLLCEEQFALNKINAERVDAVYGNNGFKADILDGHVGCILSHMKCIQMAKDNNWDSLLVFEDDVVFRENANELFDEYYSRVPKSWQLLYLGGNHWGNCLQYLDGSKQVKVDENVFRTYGTLTTHSYAIKSTMYDYMLNLLITMGIEVDMLFVKAQEQCEAYCLRPNLTWQREGFSDINNQECNYKFMQE